MKVPPDLLDCVVLTELQVPLVHLEALVNQDLPASQVVLELRETKVYKDPKDPLGYKDHEVNLVGLVPQESLDLKVPQVKMASLERKVALESKETAVPQVSLVPVDLQDYQVVLAWLE